MRKLKVLFLCTGNSCRSQMAEGWARALKGDAIEAHSAGIEKHGLNPHAVRVMGEAGVDISKQYSKTLAEIGPVEFDYVVTVCGHADENCPVFPAKTRVVHAGFEDPPKVTKDLPDGDQKLAVYRRVRDEIRAFVERMPGVLENSESRNPKAEGRPKSEGRTDHAGLRRGKDLKPQPGERR
jgi:arsenate reductase